MTETEAKECAEEFILEDAHRFVDLVEVRDSYPDLDVASARAVRDYINNAIISVTW